MTGRFISFEGIDGAGKTTHLAALAAHLRQRGATVLVTREPGGTPLAERLRELLLHAPMDALTESLLVFAARRDHVTCVVEPALQRGETVICDRFTDATFAYQGGGRGFDAGVLGTLENWVHASLQPALTLWFDVDAATAAARRGQRGDAGTVGSAGTSTSEAPDTPDTPDTSTIPDRFEQQDTAFFERVRAGYQARLDAAPQRFARIDASAAPAAVWQQVLAALEQRGW